MYLELHHNGTYGLTGSVYKKIDGVLHPFDIETQAGEALEDGLARFVFAVSLFRVEAAWFKSGDIIYIAGADGDFCDELNFPLFNNYINDISTAVFGDTIGQSFEEAESWALKELQRPYVSVAVVLDTLGVRAAWWREREKISLIARSARSQYRLTAT